MKIKTTLLAMASTVLFVSVAHATPTNSSLEKLADLSGYEAVFYENVATPLMLERMALAEGMAGDDTLTDSQRQKALDIYDAYAEGLLKSLDTQNTKDALKRAYLSAAKTNYTQGEVDAQVAFYGSEDGKSALSKQDAVLSSYIQSANNASKSTVTTYENKNLKKMQDDIKKVLKK